MLSIKKDLRVNLSTTMLHVIFLEFSFINVLRISIVDQFVDIRIKYEWHELISIFPPVSSCSYHHKFVVVVARDSRLPTYTLNIIFPPYFQR